MRSVGVYEAKTQFSKLLDEVEGGATITITRHGVPVAELTVAGSRARPTPSPDEAAAAMDAWIRYRDERNIILGDDLTIEDLIEEGRRY